MMRSVLLFTGVPGSGKTTLKEEVLRKLTLEGESAADIDEYEYVWEWARMPEHERLVRWVGDTFDLFPHAYRPMSIAVAKRLGQESARLFDIGASLVVFEIARGVGKPRADYAPFVEAFALAMGKWKDHVSFTNTEVIASQADIERRMWARFEADPTAPPPGIERKYLGALGVPLCSSTVDLGTASLDVPLVFNEMIRNGADRETLRMEVERELYHRLMAAVSDGRGVEGNQWMGRERLP